LAAATAPARVNWNPELPDGVIENGRGDIS
jgi:hypothetical protein